MTIRSCVASLLVIANFVAFSFSAFSADYSDILKFGIRETHDTCSFNNTDQNFANAMCSRSRRDRNGGIAIGGFGTINEEQGSSEDICRNEQGSLKIDSANAETIVKTSQQIITAEP